MKRTSIKKLDLLPKGARYMEMKHLMDENFPQYANTTYNVSRLSSISKKLALLHELELLGNVRDLYIDIANSMTFTSHIRRRFENAIKDIEKRRDLIADQFLDAWNPVIREFVAEQMQYHKQLKRGWKQNRNKDNEENE